MILRRYGNTIHSVTPNFDSRAMTEIGFTRDGQMTVPANEFVETYERLDGRELTAEASGDVQGDVEDGVLASPREQLDGPHREVGEERVLLIENQMGKDQAKTRGSQTTKVVENANRLYFQYTID